jgi:hypothetical protein
MVTYTQRGGATVNGTHASWPFARIEVEPGKIRLGVFGQRISLTPAEIISIRTSFWHVVFDYRTSMLGETACFQTFSQRLLIDALRAAGFTVQEGGDGFSKFSS